MNSGQPTPSMSPVSRPSSRIIERINPNLINRGDKTQTRKHEHDDPDFGKYFKIFRIKKKLPDESDGDDIGDHYDARDKKKDKRMSRSPGITNFYHKSVGTYQKLFLWFLIFQI